MKIKITHENGTVLRIDVPKQSVDVVMEQISKLLPFVPNLLQGVFDAKHVEHAMKEQQRAYEADKAAAAAAAKARKTPRR